TLVPSPFPRGESTGPFSPLGGQHPGPPRIAQVAGPVGPLAESCRLAAILHPLGLFNPCDFCRRSCVLARWDRPAPRNAVEAQGGSPPGLVTRRDANTLRNTRPPLRRLDKATSTRSGRSTTFPRSRRGDCR